MGKLHEIDTMRQQKFSLEIVERNKITKVSESVFGLLCLAVALWFAMSLQDKPSTVSAGLAIAFLAFFGIWEILSGTGAVSRYIIIGGENIILKHKTYLPAVTFGPGALKEVKFKPLAIDFCLTKGTVTTIRLGTYYRERSAEIMEAVEKFCHDKMIMTTGNNEETVKE
jgi:hypothetical protein